MMGFIEPEQAEQAPSPMMMEQEQAVAAESEAAPREEEVMPEGTAEAETGGVVLAGGPELTNETLRDWVKRWCGGDREGLPPISTWNTSKVTDMSSLFYDQSKFNDEISAWDTSSVTTMEKMFFYASSFNQPLNDWRVDNVTTMQSMFQGASFFNQPLNDWRVDNVTDMKGMFHAPYR
jgi:surface protein